MYGSPIVKFGIAIIPQNGSATSVVFANDEVANAPASFPAGSLVTVVVTPGNDDHGNACPAPLAVDNVTVDGFAITADLHVFDFNTQVHWIAIGRAQPAGYGYGYGGYEG